MTDKMYQSSDPDDIRFQFDVIRGLAESIRQLTGSINEMQKTQVGMLERLATLEASKFADAISVIDTRVDVLMRDKDRREGAWGVVAWLRIWGPVVFSALVAAVIYGRMVGLVPPSPVALPTSGRNE